jgi:DNA-directed RNA polymerase I subunit RPA43
VRGACSRTGDEHAEADACVTACWSTRYIPSLQGVLLSHSNLRFSSENAKILNDCPFAISDVTFDAIVWAPQIGQKLGRSSPFSFLLDTSLTGKKLTGLSSLYPSFRRLAVGTHSLSSPSHISLLIHQTFNVSIPLPHIPSDEYYFDASLADSPPPSPSPEPEEEPEPEADGDEDMEKTPKKEENKVEAKPVVEFSTGRWRSKITGGILGEEGEGVEFTVIGFVSSTSLQLSHS